MRKHAAAAKKQKVIRSQNLRVKNVDCIEHGIQNIKIKVIKKTMRANHNYFWLKRKKTSSHHSQTHTVIKLTQPGWGHIFDGPCETIDLYTIATQWRHNGWWPHDHYCLGSFPTRISSAMSQTQKKRWTWAKRPKKTRLPQHNTKRSTKATNIHKSFMAFQRASSHSHCVDAFMPLSTILGCLIHQLHDDVLTWLMSRDKSHTLAGHQRPMGCIPFGNSPP